MAKKEPAEDLLETDRLLTILEVARILHVSRSLMYWLIARGDLPTVRIGRAVRFRPEDVQAYIRQGAGGQSITGPERKARRLRAGKRDR
jgi:excisionase family DNA binding protein